MPGVENERWWRKREACNRTQHDKIFIASNASSLVPNDLEMVVEGLIASAQRNDQKAVQRGLQLAISGYRPRDGMGPSTERTQVEERRTGGDLEEQHLFPGNGRQSPPNVSTAPGTG